MKVNIYLETDKQCQARVQRRYGYVIEAVYAGRSTFVFAMAPGGDDKTWKLKNCGGKDGVCAQNRIQGQ